MSYGAVVLYWDASAVLSLLFDDIYSQIALNWWRQESAVHLLSSLAYIEVAAVIARLERTGALDAALAETALANLVTWGWRRTAIQPDHDLVAPLARRWPLRGADLWHLACACTLHKQLPELRLLTFDSRLHDAAAGEGIAASL